MGLRSGLTLIALGAILTFAVRVDWSYLNIQVVGLILMLTGVIAIALTRTTRRNATDHDYPYLPPSDDHVVRDQSHDVDV